MCALIAALIFLASLLGCRAEKPPVIIEIPASGAPRTSEPTPEATPRPVIAGEQLENGLTDASAPLASALGREYRAVNSSFCGENTLLVYASGGDDSFLAHYDIITAELYDRYELGFTVEEASEYSLTGYISRLQNGGALVIDVTTRDVILLDESLKETARYTDAAPKDDRDIYGDVSLAYSESENALFYRLDSEPLCVYKQTLGGELAQVLKLEEGFFAVDDLSVTEDGTLVNISVHSSFSYALPENENTYRRSMIIDAHTLETVEEGWTDLTAYSLGGARAISRSYYYLSELDGGAVKLDADFLGEYSSLAFAPAVNRAVSCVLSESMEGSALVLSSYDTAAGELGARAFVEASDWLNLPRNVTDARRVSIDPVRGNCVTEFSTSEDGYESVTTLIWEPDLAVISALPEAEALLKPALNAPYDGCAALEARIESRYGVLVFYGDELRAYHEEHPSPMIVCKTFDSESDERYIYECLMGLDDALSAYPEGMMQKISAAEDGQLAFFICTELKNTDVDFEISGNYSSSDGLQLIYVLMPADTPNDFGKDLRGYNSTFHHEICHAIQRCIFANYDREPVYTYDEWSTYWPEGYEGGSFGDVDVFEFIGYTPEDTYFLDDYATTSLLEDMSRLFEYAMWDEIDERMYYPHINERFAYLTRLIRSALGDETWPLVTRWERAVSPLAQQETDPAKAA